MQNFDGVLLTDFGAKAPEFHQRTFGPYYLSEILKSRGLRVFVLDFFFSFDDTEVRSIALKLVSKKTRFVGLSVSFLLSTLYGKGTSAEELESGIQAFVSEAKKINPAIKFIVGGNSAFASFRLSADRIFQGQNNEAEILNYFSELFDVKLRPFLGFENERVQFRDDHLILPREPLPIEISRGCIFNCKFCGFYGRGRKKNDQIKNFDLLAEFLNIAYRDFGTTSFFLGDDTFNESIEKLNNFREMVRSLSFKPQFVAFLRLDLIYSFPAMIDLLIECGVRIFNFGIETFDSRAAVAIGKGLNPNKVKTFLLELKNSHPDIYTFSGFIVGLPFENNSSVIKTNEWLLETKVLDSWSFGALGIENNPNYPDRSEFSKNIEEYGYERVERLAWKRQDTSYDQCAELANELNTHNRNKIGMSPWMMMNLTRNFSLNVLKNAKKSEANSFSDRNKFSDYKEGLKKHLGSS